MAIDTRFPQALRSRLSKRARTALISVGILLVCLLGAFAILIVSAEEEALSQQVEASWTTELSDGRSLVVAGDLNLHHDVSADRELLERFMSALGLADSGARPADAARWRRVDYVLYRSGGDVALELIEAGEALEFAHEGKPLSDHPALFARLRLRPTR